MTCREFLDLLCDGGEPGARRRAALVLHRAVCGACRAYLSSYRATVRLARSCAEPEAGAREAEDLVRALCATQRRSPPPH